MGAYRVVDIGAAALAQLMIGALDPASYVSYNLLAILCCARLFSLTLTQSRQPKTPDAPRLHPIRTAFTLPGGGPRSCGNGNYECCLSSDPSNLMKCNRANCVADWSLTCNCFGRGGAIAQIPADWLANKFDRRWVLIGLSATSIIACMGLVTISSMNFGLVFIVAAFFGPITFPIFSVSAAHANDFAKLEQTVEVNASLMFLYAVGAIFSPIIAANLFTNFGPSALFIFISSAHVLLVVFGLVRMTVRPTKGNKTRYKYLPRTSYIIGRLLRQNNNKNRTI